MSRSRIRAAVEFVEGELPFAEEGDLAAYAIFTQKRVGLPHVFAGFVDAGDADLALAFGREHYGQDQECVNLWAFPERSISGSRPDYPPAPPAPDSASLVEDVVAEAYQIFVQAKAGEWHVSGMVVEAGDGVSAVAVAAGGLKGQEFYSLWAVPRAVIRETKADDLIWRYTNQDYRLARGYAKGVRSKWEAVRLARDVDEYQKDDLRETF